MFWGMSLQGPKNKLAFMIETSIRLVNVALQPPTPEEPKLTEARLYIVDKNDDEFLVCTLNDSKLNARLDLFIDCENTVSFRIKGNGTIHMSGYYEYDDSDSDSGSESDSRSSSKTVDEIVQRFQGMQLATGSSSSGFGGEPNFGTI